MIERIGVRIQWHDDPTGPYYTKVAIDPDWTEKEDDNDIFFYFSNREEYEKAKQQDNGLEFQIIEEVN
jgi:hypothetical protein